MRHPKRGHGSAQAMALPKQWPLFKLRKQAHTATLIWLCHHAHIRAFTLTVEAVDATRASQGRWGWNVSRYYLRS